ncbi:MAG: DUF4864 domain-containing protein, partial [Catalinimonas sp.]
LCTGFIAYRTLQPNASPTLTIDQPMPTPDLAPGAVVQLQLMALQQNDAQDRGIATAFNFASPANKEVTGPLSRFRQLLRTPDYAQLLNFDSFRAEEIRIEGDRAQQIVVVTDAYGQEVTYLFELSRQSRPPFQGCWMTDGVIRLREAPSIRT